MSLSLSILPVHALLPVLSPVHLALAKISSVARPLQGAGLVAALMWLAKSVSHGPLRSASALISSKPITAAQPVKRTAANIAMLNRMASELDTQQPQMAAELRLLAAQG